MNRFFFLTFLGLFVGNLSAQVAPTNPVSFSGGVDYLHSCTDVDLTRACDSSNVVNDKYGSLSKRYGSKRFIDIPISSNPVNSLYRISVEVGTETSKVLFATSFNKILFSTGGIIPVWKVGHNHLATHNQYFSFTTINGKVIMTGDALTDPVLQFDVITSSMKPLFDNWGSSEALCLKAKYVRNENNYLILGNVADETGKSLANSTTYYPSRIYYSLVLQQSSFTASRYLDIGTNDGDFITGLSNKHGALEVYKRKSIYEVSYSILNLSSQGGDIQVSLMVDGFGCIAPRSLTQVEPYDIFLSFEGVMAWDGARRTRLNVVEEQKPISTLIKPIIEKMIKNNTYKNSAGVYYPKRQWYVFSYEDPDKYPENRNNSVLIFDFSNGEWHPIKNWLAGSLETLNATDDNGDLIYGDSNDGYVYYADIESSLNDARKELVIDTMDSTFTWTNGIKNTVDVYEGTCSVKANLTVATKSTDVYKIAILNFGEWTDKSKISKEDKLSFHLYVTSATNMLPFRVDLQVNSTESSFDNFVTSVTISSNSLRGDRQWSAIEIPISSFPIPSGWYDVTSGTLPFANENTFYGIRFHFDSVSNSTIGISIDNLRIVQNRENPLNAFSLNPNINFSNLSDKDFRQIILTYAKGAESSFSIDILTDFGNLATTVKIPNKIEKGIYLFGYNGNNGFAKLDSTDFSVLTSTYFNSNKTLDTMNGVIDRRYLYCFDKSNSRMLKFSLDDFRTIVSSFGSLGTGTTNFNTVNQMAVDDNNIYIVDNWNDRIKTHSKNKFEYVNSYGEIGHLTTNFYSPTAIACDNAYLWVCDEGNSRIVQLTKSTYGFVNEKKLDFNTIGDATFALDENYLYMAYNKSSSQKIYYQDIVLEKRNKTDLSLVNRADIKPDGVTYSSTWTLRGDISILGDYIFITFGEDIEGNSNYYMQKRLRSTFELVKEYKSVEQHWGVAVNGLSYLPTISTEKIDLKTREGTYLQLKFYETGLDNNFRLFNTAYVVESKQYHE